MPANIEQWWCRICGFVGKRNAGDTVGNLQWHSTWQKKMVVFFLLALSVVWKHKISHLFQVFYQLPKSQQDKKSGTKSQPLENVVNHRWWCPILVCISLYIQPYIWYGILLVQHHILNVIYSRELRITKALNYLLVANRIWDILK